MTSYTLTETRSFYSFLFLSFVTVGLFLYHESTQVIPDMMFGLLNVTWGLFAFYRMIYLSDFNNLAIPKILTLPSRILFDFDKQKHEKINLILVRFLKWDVLLFLCLGVSYISWGVYNTLFPIEIDLFKNFWAEKEGLLDAGIQLVQNYYPIIEELSHVVMLALLMLIGLSFSQNENTESSAYVLLPAILALGVVLIFNTDFIDTDYYSNLSYLKGIGWGQYEFFIELTEGQNIIDSGYIRRYIETGIIGVALIPLFFAPVFYCVNKSNYISKTTGWALTLVLLFLLLSDQFLTSSALTTGFQVLCLVYVSLIWGVAGRVERLK